MPPPRRQGVACARPTAKAPTAGAHRRCPTALWRKPSAQARLCRASGSCRGGRAHHRPCASIGRSVCRESLPRGRAVTDRGLWSLSSGVRHRPDGPHRMDVELERHRQACLPRRPSGLGHRAAAGSLGARPRLGEAGPRPPAPPPRRRSRRQATPAKDCQRSQEGLHPLRRCRIQPEEVCPTVPHHTT